MLTVDCGYDECPCTAVGRCEKCDAAFCSDHGSLGGDRQVSEVGPVAVPSACWRHGGFNVDE